jgi:2-iminobutanoate/2-iminopropanoate deaminase
MLGRMCARREVRTSNAPPPAGGYSQGISAGGFVFVSGQTPVGLDREPIRGPFAEQARRTFANVEAVAAASGASNADAVHLTVYLRDLGDFAEMDAAFRERFVKPRPARTTVKSDLPVPIEVDGIFHVAPSSS